MIRYFIGLSVACASLCGCAETPERVADRFVDLYFVETDQARARPLTVGLAQKKLDDELKLVESVRRTVDRDEARPTVFYERRELRLADAGAGRRPERANATYDVTIRFGGDATRKNAMLSLERVDGRWRVGNFTVAEGHLPPRPPAR